MAVIKLVRIVPRSRASALRLQHSRRNVSAGAGNAVNNKEASKAGPQGLKSHSTPAPGGKTSGGAGNTIAAAGVLGALGVGGYYYYQEQAKTPGQTEKDAKANEGPSQSAAKQASDALAKDAERKRMAEEEARAAERRKKEKDDARLAEEKKKEEKLRHAAEEKKQKGFETVAAEANIAATESLNFAESQSAEAAQQRADARSRLQLAIQSRDSVEIENAIVAARSAGLADDPDVALAKSLTEPGSVVREGFEIAQIEELLALLPGELQGLTPEKASQTVALACQGLSREQLESHVFELTRHLAKGSEQAGGVEADCAGLSRCELLKRVVELSKHLATGRVHAKVRLEQALFTHLEAANNASMRDLADAMQKLHEDRDQVMKEKFATLETDLVETRGESVARARGTAKAEVEATLEKVMVQLRATAQDVLAEERSRQLSATVAECSGLASVEDLLVNITSTYQVSHFLKRLALASLDLDNAIHSGGGAREELEELRRVAEQADRFVAQILTQLPKGCADLCNEKRPVPTETVLRQQLPVQIKELTAAAFVPPGSGLFGELVGKVFAWLYLADVDVSPAFSTETEHSKKVFQNLKALRTAISSGGAEFATVITQLERSLIGECQTRAAGWLANARHALLLHQTLQVAKAKAHCLKEASGSSFE